MSVDAWEPDRPWVRQPFDDDLSWALFQRWLLMTPRRLQGLLGSACPYTWTQLQEIAWRTAWNERAAVYDLETFEAARETVATARLESAELAAMVIKLAKTEIKKLQVLADAPGNFPVFQHPHHTIRLASEAHKMARLQEGQSTERVDVGPDLSSLNVDELRALRAITKKARPSAA